MMSAMRVEVFKTNVSDTIHAEQLLDMLTRRLQLFRASFDLEDCDRVLRVVGMYICPGKIIDLLTASGFQCQELE